MTISETPDMRATIEIVTASQWITSVSQLAPKLQQSQRRELEDAARIAKHLTPSKRSHYLRARRHSEPVGLAWGQHLPGSMGKIQNVITAETETDETVLALVNGIDQEFQKQEVSFSMMILQESSYNLQPILKKSGYDSLCQVETLYQQLISERDQPVPPTLEFIPGAESDPAALISMIEATYQQSLDCPKLQEMRSTHEILVGYQNQGSIPTGGWSFVHHDNTAIGCLLMTAFRGERHWELTYFGLIPEARGRGWGIQVVEQACSRAAKAGAELLITTVDRTNRPALAIYKQLGFILLEKNEIYAKQLKDHQSSQISES